LFLFIIHVKKDKTAIKFYDAVCSRFLPYRAKPFDLLEKEDVENDNNFHMLEEFVLCLIGNRILKGWSYKGGWERTDTERLSWDRIEKLWNPIYGLLRTRFPTVKFFHGPSTDQSWWMDMKSDLKKGYNREKNQAKDEAFDPKCRALYIVNRREHIRYDPKTIAMDHKLDLLNIVRIMKRKSVGENPLLYERIAQLVTSGYAVPRGGEIKFQRFSYWVYDPFFSVLILVGRKQRRSTHTQWR